MTTQCRNGDHPLDAATRKAGGELCFDCASTEHGTEDTCPKAPHSYHEPDLSTLTIESDGGELYLDVNCQYGRSGCMAGPEGLRRLATGVQW